MKLKGIDISGNYISEDGNQILKIDYGDPNLGYFSGQFINKSTPLGELQTMINDANTRYAFVSGDYNCGLGIYIWYRTEDWSDVIFDYWAGTITDTKQLIMSGAQSYSSSADGVISETQTFNNVKFILQK